MAKKKSRARSKTASRKSVRKSVAKRKTKSPARKSARKIPVRPAAPSMERAQERVGPPPAANVYPDVSDLPAEDFDEEGRARTEGQSYKRVDIGDKTMDQGK